MTDPTESWASLHAYHSYRDAAAALRWLQEAIGFEITMQYPDDHGGIMHAELRRGDVAIFVFSDDGGSAHPVRSGETVGHGLYLALESESAVDAAYSTAVAADAEVIWKPENTEWGNYRFRVLDPEGYEWTFGTHRPGQPTADWSDAG